MGEKVCSLHEYDFWSHSSGEHIQKYDLKKTYKSEELREFNFFDCCCELKSTRNKFMRARLSYLGYMYHQKTCEAIYR